MSNAAVTQTGRRVRGKNVSRYGCLEGKWEMRAVLYTVDAKVPAFSCNTKKPAGNQRSADTNILFLINVPFSVPWVFKLLVIVTLEFKTKVALSSHLVDDTYVAAFHSTFAFLHLYNATIIFSILANC